MSPDDTPRVTVVGGSADEQEVAALVAGLVAARSAAPAEPAPAAPSRTEWQRRARPGAKNFSPHTGARDAWRWRER